MGRNRNNAKAGVCVVGGRRLHFHSKGERQYCQYLDMLKESRSIADWEYEGVRYKCSNGKFYTPDFHVATMHGTLEIHEFKGELLSNNVTQIKFLVKDHHIKSETCQEPDFDEYHLIFKKDPGWAVRGNNTWLRLSKLQHEHPEIHVHYIGSTLAKLGFTD